MRVLVIGASGFLGSALTAALQDAGHAVTCGVRDVQQLRRSYPQAAAAVVDFSAPAEPAQWLPLLRGFDAVVNAAGILRQRRRNRFEQVHDRGPRALYAACAEAGVRRIVHISALGADALAASAYHRSKRSLDEFLLALPVRAVVLQPSLVFGPGGASAALFLGLAGLPLTPLPDGGLQMLQPVHRDDVCAAVVRLLQDDAAGRIAVVGPRCIVLRDYVALLRRQLGLGPLHPLSVPGGLVRLVAGVGPGDVVADRDTLAMLERGNCAEVAPLVRLLGRAPRDPAEFLGMADRRWARDAMIAFWAEPAARLSLAFLWIVSGVVSLRYPLPDSLALLARVGLHGGAAEVALYGAALLDIALGALLLPRRWRRLVYAAQLALTAAYTVLITVGLPEFWLHPYAPVVKNLPIAVLTLMLLQREPRRGLSRR